MTLTVGSLFSGIGGIDLGLERAGMKVLWQVELDPWCRAVLAKHWPDAERHADVRSVGAATLRPVDIIAGGFPCQDISYAGRGAGIEGSRSGLWSEYARIIRELRPRYVIVENVPALRSRGLGVVLGDLAALGYDAEWDCVPASAVGAPHRRDRIWILGHARELGPSRRFPDAEREELRDERQRIETPERRHEGSALAGHDGGESLVADADAIGRYGWSRQLGEAGRSESADGRVEDPDSESVDSWRRGRGAPQTSRWWWAAEPNVGRVAYGVPARLDRLTGLGNAVVPQVSELIGRLIVEAEEEVAA